MTKHEFKVGDQVRIRKWEDMVAEFGTVIRGPHATFIECSPRFTSHMIHLCRKSAVIKSITFNASKSIDLIFAENVPCTSWEFSTDMIEPIEDDSVTDKPAPDLHLATPTGVYTEDGRILGEKVRKALKEILQDIPSDYSALEVGYLFHSEMECLLAERRLTAQVAEIRKRRGK